MTWAAFWPASVPGSTWAGPVCTRGCWTSSAPSSTCTTAIPSSSTATWSPRICSSPTTVAPSNSPTSASPRRYDAVGRPVLAGWGSQMEQVSPCPWGGYSHRSCRNAKWFWMSVLLSSNAPRESRITKTSISQMPPLILLGPTLCSETSATLLPPTSGFEIHKRCAVVTEWARLRSSGQMMVVAQPRPAWAGAAGGAGNIAAQGLHRYAPLDGARGPGWFHRLHRKGATESDLRCARARLRCLHDVARTSACVPLRLVALHDTCV